MTKDIPKGAHIYFMGIAGTGMAAVAGLIQQSGYKVSGSDGAIYPPTSTMLAALKIPVATPYGPKNVDAAHPDLIVVANALSRGHEELEYALSKDIQYTSFPKLLGDLVLSNTTSIVVAGTHGKTTTTALLAFVLKELGHDPGFLIGGVPQNLPQAFAVGRGKIFIIEGDEYDTAFFDKGSKFLHYCPKFAILNNLEYDHADIFPDLAAIEAQFTKFIGLVPDSKNLIANVDDPGMRQLIERLGLKDRVTRVATRGIDQTCPDGILRAAAQPVAPGHEPLWNLIVRSRVFGTLELVTPLTGSHNAANVTQAIALLGRLKETGVVSDVSVPRLKEAIRKFTGVKRRLEWLANSGGVDIFEDFAHHPTAVGLVIDGFRASYAGRRILVAFEPKNATSRRNVFTREFANALGKADLVFIGKCPDDRRIAPESRMDTTTLARLIGEKAAAYNENEDLAKEIAMKARAGDAVIFMSAGSFSGVQYRLAELLKRRNEPKISP